MVREPFTPGMGVVGHVQQQLLADAGGAPVRLLVGGLGRKDHQQFLGMQAMADQPWQVTAGHANGGIDLAGVEVDGFDTRMQVHKHARVRLVEVVQARQQPFGAKGGQGGQAQSADPGLIGQRL